MIAPFAEAAARLDEIPGIGLAGRRTSSSPRSAPDMTRFPTAGHLASWAKLARA